MKKEKTVEKDKLLIFLTGLIIGLLGTAAAIFLFSLLMYLFEIDRSFSTAFATLSLAVGAFLSSLYTAKKIGNRGYLIGLAVGFGTFALVTLISLFINKGPLTLNTIFHLIIILLSSVSGGILGVNKGKNKKYI